MNNIAIPAILGIIQGLTEFLPVSSSGHLVIASHLLNLNEPGVIFETILHLGTTFAVLYYFRTKIMEIKFETIKYLIIASIPAAIVGLLFQGLIEDLFSSVFVVGVALLVTGFLNYRTDKFNSQRQKFDILDSITIGLAQAFAIIPGISRSGTTIFAGSMSGLKKTEVAYFSFILSIPAIIGANILEIISYGPDFSLNFSFYLVGFIAAFVTGLFAIELVMRFLLSKNFKIFAVYCVALGLLVLITQY